jgi:hypothetical protein
MLQRQLAGLQLGEIQDVVEDLKQAVAGMVGPRRAFV